MHLKIILILSMKINNDILIGVEYPKLCNFWKDLVQYKNQLLEYTDLDDTHFLDYLMINKTKDETELHTMYFIRNNDIIDLYNLVSHIRGDYKHWVVEKNIKFNVEDLIKTSKFVLDMNFFINNN